MAAGELVLAFVSVEAGLVLEAVLLAALVNQYTFAFGVDDRARDALIVLALVPLARLASFVLPQAALASVYWEALIYVPILVGMTLVGELIDAKWLKLGRGRCRWSIHALVALSGLVISLALVKLDLEQGMADIESPSLRGQAIVVLFVSGVTIELLFRGLLQSALTVIFGRIGVGLASGAFAMLFVGTRSTAYVLVAAAVGLGFGAVVHRTESVIGVAIAHGLLNVGSYVVWPELG
jgi:membrane protease YdiL (CAAX protease family)